MGEKAKKLKLEKLKKSCLGKVGHRTKLAAKWYCNNLHTPDDVINIYKCEYCTYPCTYKRTYSSINLPSGISMFISRYRHSQKKSI